MHVRAEKVHSFTLAWAAAMKSWEDAAMGIYMNVFKWISGYMTRSEAMGRGS